MKDVFDQEIVPGSNVVWVGGKTCYAGVRVYKVLKITEKKVTLNKGKNTSVSVWPDCVVVVDRLLKRED